MVEFDVSFRAFSDVVNFPTTLAKKARLRTRSFHKEKTAKYF